MALFLAFFSLTAAITVATGTAAVLWAQFVGKGIDDRDLAEAGGRAGLDIRTW